MEQDLGERRKRLESLVGRQSYLYLEGHTTSVRVILRHNGEEFLALDEGGAEYPVAPEDFQVFGQTILSDQNL